MDLTSLSVVLYVVAIVLFAIAAFAQHAISGGTAGRIHFGWLGLAFFALAHISLS